MLELLTTCGVLKASFLAYWFPQQRLRRPLLSLASSFRVLAKSTESSSSISRLLSEQQRILFSPSTSQFLGSFRLKKNRCFFRKMACQIFFFHISSPLNTVDYFRGEIHLNRSNVANVLPK